MPKFIIQATHNVQHDGKPYGEGASIELTDEQAAPLLASGIIEPATKGKAKAEAPAE